MNPRGILACKPPPILATYGWDRRFLVCAPRGSFAVQSIATRTESNGKERYSLRGNAVFQRHPRCSDVIEEGWRRGSESNRRIKVLQTSPLPLGYRSLSFGKN